MDIRNNELRTTREAMRELNAILDQLRKGDIEKMVLTQKGKIRGVLISPESFERYESALRGSTTD